ncbi:hypothetical protein C1Y18_27985 [Pseudomonas sp. MPR-R5A]|nr:hypothetical protein C1Y25_28170 [Pseudomonas sp. MPBC4-3]PMX42589.1 hypothetical protein C1Y20_28485 [Pseudomonas sp. FW301-21B01]PMY02992.1 hypothetical protein C1Y18_27985 [Pseudomonas sp. MPR-R5A]
MRACQLMHVWLTHRYRGQAPSHSLICIHQVGLSWLLLWLLRSWSQLELGWCTRLKMWEGACPR